MPEPIFVVSIESIITSHTLIFWKYKNKEIPRSNYQKIEWAKNDVNASLCFVLKSNLVVLVNLIH
jgi:hypothetical protein